MNKLRSWLGAKIIALGRWVSPALPVEKPSTERPWVREHNGNPPFWHYYPDYHGPALCGRDPIPGAPIVYDRVPFDWQGSKICNKCFDRSIEVSRS